MKGLEAGRYCLIKASLCDAKVHSFLTAFDLGPFSGVGYLWSREG